MTELLAIHGGIPIYRGVWPRWPVATQEAKRRVLAVLEGQRWAVSGPPDSGPILQVELASRFATFIGSKFAVPCSSGTAALIIALRAVGAGPGDEVIVPALTWVATAAAALDVGATVVVVDVDESDLGLRAGAVGHALGPRTRAIIPVHYACSVANMGALLPIARRNCVPVIEDCAQATGASYRGAVAGSIGDMGAFSMQQTKTLTCGEGGMVTTNDALMYHRAEQLRLDGRTYGGGTAPEELVEVGELLGSNRSMSEIQAAILLEQLDVASAQQDLRRRGLRILDASLGEIPGVEPFRAPEHIVPSCYLYPIAFADDILDRHSIDFLRRALGAELGFELLRCHPPLAQSPLLGATAWARALVERGTLRFHPSPTATRIWERTLCIPHHILLADEDPLRRISEAFFRVVAS